jgi:hypothetical protein
MLIFYSPAVKGCAAGFFYWRYGNDIFRQAAGIF